MKAVVYHAYGDRSVLVLEEQPDPGAPRAGDVRVRVHASSVNPVDGKIRRGELKLIAGGHFPKRPGLDFSGTVDAIGDDASGFKVGDAVFGAARSLSEGAFAEYVLVHAGAVAKQPATIDQTAAAAVPTVAVAALQVLRDIVKVNPGDRILVNGCTGGVGLFALQFAKHAGAIVTGVCGTDGVALARELGADEVLDYKRGATPSPGAGYRAILELSGRWSFDAAQESLDEHGLYVDFSPSPAALIGNTIANPFRSRKHVFAMTAAKTADLEFIAREIDAGRLRPAPTRVFPLERFADAFAIAEGGGVLGKVVVRVAAEA
jgi:NADPH:quinone reductase-like Zn-dependent oxidoreductase